MPADETDVVRIFEENDELLRQLGHRSSPVVQARDVIHRETLPPNGTRERARAFVIRRRDEDEIDGVVGCYGGYPAADTLYIGDLFLRPRCHGQGIGREVMDAVENRARGEFTEIRLAIDSGNWGALRFWVRIGYDRITKLVDVAGPDAPPRIELARGIGS